MLIHDLDCLETFDRELLVIGGGNDSVYAYANVNTTASYGFSGGTVDAVALGKNTFTSGKLSLNTVVTPMYGYSSADASAKAIAQSGSNTASAYAQSTSIAIAVNSYPRK